LGIGTKAVPTGAQRSVKHGQNWDKQNDIDKTNKWGKIGNEESRSASSGHNSRLRESNPQKKLALRLTQGGGHDGVN